MDKQQIDISPQLEQLHMLLDDLRTILPIVAREEIVKVFDKKISKFLKIEGHSAFTPIVSDADRNILLPVQYVVGIMTAPHYLSESDTAVGFYIVSPGTRDDGRLVIPIGIQYLPYKRYVLHVQGLHMDTEGRQILYEDGSMIEDFGTLKPLPIYEKLKGYILNFPVGASTIGRKNMVAQKAALDDLTTAEKQHRVKRAL